MKDRTQGPDYGKTAGFIGGGIGIVIAIVSGGGGFSTGKAAGVGCLLGYLVGWPIGAIISRIKERRSQGRRDRHSNPKPVTTDSHIVQRPLQNIAASQPPENGLGTQSLEPAVASPATADLPPPGQVPESQASLSTGTEVTSTGNRGMALGLINMLIGFVLICVYFGYQNSNRPGTQSLDNIYGAVAAAGATLGFGGLVMLIIARKVPARRLPRWWLLEMGVICFGILVLLLAAGILNGVFSQRRF